MNDREALVSELVGDRADTWDLTGLIPAEPLRKLGEAGLLCGELPEQYGGLGLSSLDNGRFTAHVGSLCSSLRSVMTSQGMAAWTIQRLGSAQQRADHLPRLTSGTLAAVGFSEPEAGSDLSAISTEIRPDGDDVVVDGRKVWVTAAHYAHLLVIFGRYGDGAAAVLVPADAPGVTVERVADPMGCRAAGHAGIRLDSVRLPRGHVLGGAGAALTMLVTAALSYGRMSVAWGCVGILRACLAAASRHAKSREQFGRPLAQHQLIGGHLADLLVAEQTATRVCEHASHRWDEGSPDMVTAAVLAKHVGATQAAAAAATAVQVLASAGASDGHVVARAYRDAKLMEIIEGSNELCRLMLAQHALSVSG
ncbi:acyl-CoA dehydrogenase family protein [Streptomyces malaysiensis]|uniref:Acyl-CoA dehydrogenase family protein n=1 Tax=Streptomyces malaysiensis subsp. samsunensis TaxID=459658 RepID=A0A9X2M2P6_STRMQ|nr:acyl-CoA dehydrogenase family protein [Streptomyces samsunensis]MCQ8833961.1 acyl-CoA dehydrogenase family protein [Streptomyces samsunensis]